MYLIVAWKLFFNLEESFTRDEHLNIFRYEINSSWAKFEGRAAI
jgi:hypothetical protein